MILIGTAVAINSTLNRSSSMELEMTSTRFTTRLMLVVAILTLPPGNFLMGQEAEIRWQEQRTASIEKMRKRIAEIEKEVKSAGVERAQELGEEAFGLFGEIDQTYLQMIDSYQQQVVLLNERMRQMWENVERKEGESRESIDRKLALIQSDWDRVYQQLTQTHDRHLEQLKNSIAKLRGEFSESALLAERELETGHFESLVRWEQAHEIFLKISQTFAKTIGDQLAYVQDRVRDNPDIPELNERLERVRTRFRLSQKRLQQRYLSHVDHLAEELAIRQLQYGASNDSKDKQRIRYQLEHLCSRTHSTYQDLQDSYRETIAALTSISNETKSKLKSATNREREVLEERVADLQSEVRQLNDALISSDRARISFIRREVAELANWTSEVTEEEKNRLEAKTKSLNALAESLRAKIQ